VRPLGGLAVAAILCGCPRPIEPVSTSPVATEATFSGSAALARVRELMQWPRGLGDPRRAASIETLADALARASGAPVQRVAHTAADPQTGSSYALVELVAHVRPRAARRLVLATHFDTRPWADEEPDAALHDRPVPGANDGTSGVAVVLELLPHLRHGLPEDVGISVVLFDGEELGRPDGGGYCMGSRHLAERIAAGHEPVLASAEIGIVLDMVGDADLHIPIEPGSQRNAPALVEHVWAVAAELGAAQFGTDVRPRGIVDDHKFLTEAGIPSILLIDREYAHWHRTTDTIDKLSARSLAAVGEVVRVAVLRWFARERERGILRP